MSHSTTVFIRPTDVDFSEMMVEISEHLGLNFVIDESVKWQLYVCRSLGLELRFFENEGMVDDDKVILFTRYRYALSIQVIAWPGDEGIFHTFRQTAAVFVAKGIFHKLGYEVAVVDECQTVLWSSDAGVSSPDER